MDCIYKIVSMAYGDIHHAQSVQIPVIQNRLKLDGSEIYIKTTQQRIDDYIASQEVTYDQIFPAEFTQNFDDCDSVKVVLDSPDWTKPFNEY